MVHKKQTASQARCHGQLCLCPPSLGHGVQVLGPDGLRDGLLDLNEKEERHEQ
jgi:hypothetical protein